ncbi:MAG TPA: hypothetical protein VHL98_15465 [Microvirga sp.]|nr:hypothetical protein [Microvirga sp.]
MAITKPDWDAVPGHEGAHISALCQNKLTDDTLNHCAHFVSHALGITLGYTCAKQTGGKNDAASIRVHEIFAACNAVGKWADRPASLDPCLIFITNANNVDLKKKTMVNHPRKHIGVYKGGWIYHYSNTKDKVVKQDAEDFKKHYSPPFNGLFYGDIGKFVK